ncbi:MAG: DUF885 family protein, partial [Sphingomonas sp.]|nr:DUF885 family protein [Sphingomonas sp.]
MDRRSFVVSTGAVALSATLPAYATLPPAQPVARQDSRLRSMLDRFFYARLEDSPERATGLGLDVAGRAHLRSRLGDYSAAGQAKGIARARAELAELRTVERAQLSATAALDYDVVEYDLTRTLAGARFPFGSAGGRYSPYVISQLTGPYRGVPDFLDTTHPIKNRADADAYVARLDQFDVALDQSTDRQRQDAARGVFAPDYVLDTALKQLRTLRDQPAAQTVLVTSLVSRAREAGVARDYGANAERIVASQVFPALDRQIALVTELRSRATHDAGVWRLPEGEAYYAGALKAATTTEMTAEEIHRLGLEQVADLEARLDP